MNRLGNLKFRHYFNCSKLLLQQPTPYNNLVTRMLCEKSDEDKKTSINKKFTVFRDEESPMILDVEEERNKFLEQEEIEKSEKYEKYSGINLSHGETGVFDVKDLITVLRQESMENIFVAKVPKEHKYVEYIVITTGKSVRHIFGVAELVRKLYKIKRNDELIPKLEGKTGTQWLAMDLGNIALHLFEKKTRITFDLETLWSVGSEFDEKCQKQEDKYSQMLESNLLYLENLKPLKSKSLLKVK